MHSGIIVKEQNGDYILELWAASTKHPDSVFYFSEWKAKHGWDLLEDKYQVMQWLLYCASQLSWPFHAKELAEYALENWANWR